jgi:hypothetical protein
MSSGSGSRLAQRRHRCGQIEVGRRGGRAEHPDVGQPDPNRVAGEDDPAVGVVQGQVVLGVAGRVDGGQGAPRADRDGLPVGQHVDALGRGGVQAAVERVEQVAVDHGG